MVDNSGNCLTFASIQLHGKVRALICGDEVFMILMSIESAVPKGGGLSDLVLFGLT